MHLKKLPTYYMKGDDRRAAYYTIQARELIADGYVEEGVEAGTPEAAEIKTPEPLERQPEVVVEAGADAFDSTDSLTEPMAATDALEEMTKAELLGWAMDHGHDLKNALPKAEIFKLCKEIEAEA
jgi:hypothetical protein